MRGRGEDGPPGDEGEPEEMVLPLPYVAEERALREELERLNGTWTDGPLSVIRVPRPGGSGWIYLSGPETLFTNFVERAYVLAEDDAKRLIGSYPVVLRCAEVVVRGRRPRSAESLDQRCGGRSSVPSGRPREAGRGTGRKGSGSRQDVSHDAGEQGEDQYRQAKACEEDEDRHEEADEADDQATEDEPGE